MSREWQTLSDTKNKYYLPAIFIRYHTIPTSTAISNPLLNGSSIVSDRIILPTESHILKTARDPASAQ